MGSGRRVFAGKIVTVAFQVWTCLCYYSLLRTEGQHAHTSFPFHQNLNRAWFMTWLKCQDILWRAAGWPYSYNQSVRNQAFRAVWESIPVGPTTRLMYTTQKNCFRPIRFSPTLGHWIWCTELAGCPSFFGSPAAGGGHKAAGKKAANSWCCVATRWGCMKKFCSFGLQVSTDMILCTSTVLILLNKLFRNFYI